MKKIFLALLLLLSVRLNAQQLTPEEKRIVELIKKQMPQNMQLLEDMVNINSGSLNVEGVRKTGNLLSEEFEKIGFSTRWVTLPDSLKRAGHLVASIKARPDSLVGRGKKGKKLLLIGHLDTVFEPDMDPNPYKKLDDTSATGQGVNDMKGGDVIIFAALKALQQLGLLKDATIFAYFTGDEEKAGIPTSVSRADFIETAKQSDIALGFEAAQGLHTVATARRGSSEWKLTVKGVQAHSAGVFSSGYGSIYEASRILNSFREELSNEKYLTFNPGLIAGGADVDFDSSKITATVAGKTNIISPVTYVQGDLRFLTEKQKATARERMRRIVSTNNLKATSATITFRDGYPAMEPTAGNDSLVQVLNKVTMAMGIGSTNAGDPGSRGAGDISFVAKYVNCLDGLGASGRGAHAPGEIINLKEYPLLIERAAIFIYRLTR